MRNVNTTQLRYEVKVIFPEWCEVEGEYTYWRDSEVEASEFASKTRRDYPPCSVEVFEFKVRVQGINAWTTEKVLVGYMNRKSNWWRN